MIAEFVGRQFGLCLGMLACFDLLHHLALVSDLLHHLASVSDCGLDGSLFDLNPNSILRNMDIGTMLYVFTILSAKRNDDKIHIVHTPRYTLYAL